MFGLKVPSGDGLRLILQLKKCFDELNRPKKGKNKAWKVEDSSFSFSKNRKKIEEEAVRRQNLNPLPLSY